MCGSILLVVAVAATAPNLASPEARYFPGSYFEQQAKARLQNRALEVWPGPSELVRIWFSDDFDGQGRVALLLGAAAFHDPQLLPVYRDAIASGSQRIRQAAAYGYRDLIGDRLPDVRHPIDDRTAGLLADEMAVVADTLRRHELVEVWLQALLAPSGAAMPGYGGVLLNRSPSEALRALDRIVEAEDLRFVVDAWQASDELETQIGLVRLAEGLALEQFVQKPGGTNPVWGPQVYERAGEAFAEWVARWTRDGCEVDVAEVQRAQLAAMGLSWVTDPFNGEACHAWQQVLLLGPDVWWPVAVRQLYRCGGPHENVVSYQLANPATRAARERVIEFFGLRQAPRAGADAGE